ncbi:hypothetical protein AQF52_0222 [Streptomyces venezuelae]|nr:hypothetical protein AQF52_0222 [Streptomyces venezuelae]CUM43970.1 hypothetical protein BN2537_16905 [Streptomyces venezuelae]
MSRAGIKTLIPVLLALVTTDTRAGHVAAGVLLTAFVLVGVVGRRYERPTNLFRPERSQPASRA